MELDSKPRYYTAKYPTISQMFCQPVFELQAPKAVIKVVLAGRSVAMVTYCVTKMTPACSPMTGQFVDTMIVAQSDKEWLQ